MLRRRCASVAALLFATAASSLAIAADTFKVDPVHSSVIFKIAHFDTANFYGRFGRIEGSVTSEGDKPTALEVKVEADSIDTNNADRDKHLRGPDFFDTKQYPDITFKSTAVKPGADDKSFEVTGDLNLHGTAKPITVKLTKIGQGQNVKGTPIVGYEATFTVKRSEFGMSGYINKGIGDEVTLTVSLEAVKQ